jgi:hypothetical protein
MIKQEFIMTTDAIPVPVKTKKVRKQCKNCKRLEKRIVKGLCNRCEVYKLSGRDRPKKFFSLRLLCENADCRKVLKYDPCPTAGKCNACYRREMRRNMIKLSKTQLGFLKIAGPGQWNCRGGWFNRKDVFLGHLNYMPYSTGLSLFKKGLLETDPPYHPVGYDLSFRITEKGLKFLEDQNAKG